MRKSIELSEREVAIYDDEVKQSECTLAFVLIEKWGAIAACPNGEDSAGRQKLKLMDEEDLVNRAFKISELAHKYARKHAYITTEEDITKRMFPSKAP